MKKILAIKIVFLFNIVIFTLLFAADESKFTGIEGIENLTESQMKADWEELTPVLKEYFLLLSARKIPGIEPNEKGWRFEAFKLTQKYILSQEFNAKQFQKEIQSCPDLFKVDARKESATEKIIRVFLCKKKEKIELMSVYSFEKSKWIKKK